MYQRLQCRDTYFFKIKFVFFICLLLSASWKENELPLCIYFLYQTVVYRFLGVSILQLLIVYHIYDLRTMICWRCHSNSLNTGSRLPYLSDVKTRKRRNVVGTEYRDGYGITLRPLIQTTLHQWIAILRTTDHQLRPNNVMFVLSEEPEENGQGTYMCESIQSAIP